MARVAMRAGWRGEYAAAVRPHSEALSADVLRTMRRIVPVDTGELQRSCFSFVRPNGDIFFGATAAHTPYVEFGTERMQAQSFIRGSAYLYYGEYR